LQCHCLTQLADVGALRRGQRRSRVSVQAPLTNYSGTVPTCPIRLEQGGLPVGYFTNYRQDNRRLTIIKQIRLVLICFSRPRRPGGELPIGAVTSNPAIDQCE
jgi:hypothetical protein